MEGKPWHQVAPFVAKTYEMVNDPRSDPWIRWGKANNSFLVLHPNEFSQFLLPSYFKHCNFSSFVRQLNTYGFKKVDPDRWEFAHESFLRGQIHLLHLIIRRKIRTQNGVAHLEDKKFNKDLVSEEEHLLRELCKLRQEQQALDEELQIMSKRLQATERQPQQMMSFLVKVAENPELLQRLLLSKQKQNLVDSQQKKARIGLGTGCANYARIGERKGDDSLSEQSRIVSPSDNVESDHQSSKLAFTLTTNDTTFISHCNNVTTATQMVGLQCELGSSDGTTPVKFPFSLFL